MNTDKTSTRRPKGPKAQRTLRLKQATPLTMEQQALREINDAKFAVLIEIRMWTRLSSGRESSMETSSRTLRDAASIIKKHERFHANWQLTFISQ